MKRVIFIIVEVIFIVLIIFSLIKIYYWHKEEKNIKKELNNITNKVIIGKGSKRKIDLKELKKINSDTIGWLTIKNTNIDYPVLQTNNNTFYLNHSFYKNKSNTGWIFMDYNNKLDDKNIIIYGHNRLDNIMFGDLKRILDKKWYSNKDNLKIKFITEQGSNTYKIFSVYKIKTENYYLKNNFDNNEYNKFIDKIKNRSIIKFNINTNDINQILTLSTCTIIDDYRLVIHAKKIEP